MEQLKVFAKYRYLLLNLIERDLKVKYRRSALGLIWSVLNPLLMMLVQFIVFNTIFKNTIENFAVYLIAGNLIFQFFSEGTQTAMSSVLGAAPLIKKVYVPKYIFPLEKVLFSLVNTLFCGIALVIVAIATNLTISWNILFIPVPLLLAMLFNLGVGLILATCVVFFRDIMHLYGVLIMALTYFTPLFYDESLIRDTAPAIVYQFLRVNPLYWYVAMFREVILYANAPTAQQMLICSAWSVVMLVVGLIVFRKAQDKFILYV
ncbi:MAG: ABC transporter permease [Oscillospiraceae bacterium]|nr:ABC transporter permease [Oscillospiraceae bacterium]